MFDESKHPRDERGRFTDGTSRRYPQYKAGGTMFVTADHGNCEMMKDENTGAPYTAHTTFDVKAVLVAPPDDVRQLASGRLADIAPTLLDLMQIEQPKEMTGKSLLIKR